MRYPVLLVAVMLAASLLGWGQLVGADPNTTHHHDQEGFHAWSLHIESETEVPFTHHHVAEIVSLEAGIRLRGHWFFTGTAFVHFGDGIHFGGGLGARYETRRFELIGRVLFDHRFEEFPHNAVRGEIRVTGWLHPHFGVIGRTVIENFPSLVNSEENSDEWDLAGGLGVMGRFNHHFAAGALFTLRVNDVSAVHTGAQQLHPAVLALLEGSLW